MNLQGSVSLKDVVALFQLERSGEDCFHGPSLDLKWGYLFGGQIAAQALAAAERTVEADQTAHSLHGYFLRPGDERIPVSYVLRRVRDGKSFATRHVDAIQGGHAIFTLIASFQREESGFEHQADMPQTPGPEGLMSQGEIARACGERMPDSAREQLSLEGAIEIRPVHVADPITSPTTSPMRRVWYRATERLPDSPALHRHLLTYVSDLNLLSTAMDPHALSWLQPDVQAASLDHAIWFHRPFRMDEWLLYVNDSPSAQGARGYARGQFFTQDGRLVASTAQEGLIRLTKKDAGTPQ